MATYVGLDPGRDINWVTGSSPKPKELFVEGKIDAFFWAFRLSPKKCGRKTPAM